MEKATQLVNNSQESKPAEANQLSVTNLYLGEISSFFDQSEVRQPFPLGVIANCIIGKNSLIFYYIDNCLQKIIQCPTNQIIHRSCYCFFDKFVVAEHQLAVNDLFQKAIMLLEQHWQEDPVVNLLFNIKSNIANSKRILLQLQKSSLQTQEDEPLLKGKINDVHALCSDGLPKLMLIKNNSPEKAITSDEILKKNNLPFGLNLKELNVLELKCQGKRTKEISSLMKISEMSIYSIIRDLKEKTKMDIIPLIQLLSEKGIINKSLS